MARSLHPHTKLGIFFGILPFLAVAIIVVAAVNRRADSDQNLGKSVILTPSPSPVVQPVVQPSPSPSASASESPTPSPTASPTVTAFPDSAKVIVTNFYTAFKNKDVLTLSKMFTPDPTDELKSLHSRLFTGADLEGNPGGPTLFATNSANQVVISYTVTKTSLLDNQNWLVFVTEKRVDGQGVALKSDVNTQLYLNKAGAENGGWLIDQYLHEGATSKYDGFLVQ